MSGRFEFLEHTSEVGIEATGGTCEEAFEAVGQGVATLLGAWFPGEGTTRAVSVRSSDREALLAAWVDELLYLHEAEDLVFGGFHLDRVTDGALDGRATAAPAAGHALEGVGVKAATYHGLLVGRRDGAWVARIFVDV
ncbi:MAG: archease [Actinomycetota bacterium]